MSDEEQAADALAAAWMAAPDVECEALRRSKPEVSDTALAWALQRLCYRVWNSEPRSTQRVADLVGRLASGHSAVELDALASWTRGIDLLTRGEIPQAESFLARAGAGFETLGFRNELAQTQIGRMSALAMLARYDEAVNCGQQAREVFEQTGDARSAAKVELNLGNLAAQRDRYTEAASYFDAARRRLAVTDETESLVVAISGLAEAAARQHHFEQATCLYAEAYAEAERGGHLVLLAAIEGDLGALALLRGQHDQALRLLERSRYHYDALAMPQYVAIAEEKTADAYAELNLLPEALLAYDRSLGTYEAAQLHTDQAWAHSQRGRVLAKLGRSQAAALALDASQLLFTDEDNPVGLALVGLWRAELALGQGDAQAAAAHARSAEPALRAVRHMNWCLHALGVLADALHVVGDPAEAERCVQALLAEAEMLGLPQPRQRALLRLGRLARERGELAAARGRFEAAVASIESQRGSLPGEAFRGAFLGDKLLPYRELVRLALDEGGADAPERALAWVERARARALADQMDEGDSTSDGTDTAAGEAGDASVAALRQRLNACYRQLARPLAEDGPSPDYLLEEVRGLEAALLEQDRRRVLAGVGPAAGSAATAHDGQLDLAALHRALGEHSALVEYFAVDDALFAAVVSEGRVRLVPLPLGEAAAARLVEQLRFQTDTLRHGTAHLAHRLPELQRRALHHLQGLHAGLWAPLEPLLGARRAVVVPHGALHYLPFEALHDGRAHAIERREFLRCASAGVLLRCLARPDAGLAGASALILGYGDERLPQVGPEVARVAALFPGALALAGEQASGAALRAEAPGRALLHIACHAQFRNDSPRFSALHLADGAFTARDAARLRLRCGLLTLSACDTGVSALMPGDELIGLTHAFLSAGAVRVLASLWTVQDDAAGGFMEAFYRRLRAGSAPAAALRLTQREALADRPHPYFWAAFTLNGCW